MMSQINKRTSSLFFGFLGMLAPLSVWAQDGGGGPNLGNTAWVLTSTALVLFMTLPGLSLFYDFTWLVSLLWLFYGDWLAFVSGNDWFGGVCKLFLSCGE